MKKLIVIFSILSNIAFSQVEYPLYDGIPPGNKQAKNQEVRTQTDTGRDALTKVTIPSITFFKAESTSPNAPAVIICPGGGYFRLSIFDGGNEVAKEFTKIGIHAIVLKYRTSTDSAYSVPFEQIPLQDLHQAYQITKTNAIKWGIDMSKLGIVGLSAGGHLSAMTSTPQFKLPWAFQVLVYPIISFQDKFVLPRMQSRKTLIGVNPSEEKKRMYSPELHVTETISPTFLVQSADDTQANVHSTLAYYQALLEKKVPAQLLLYQKGGHGYSLHNKVQDEYWFPSVEKWLILNNILTKK